MKITRPGSQIPAGASEEAAAPKAPEGTNFADKLEQTSGPNQASAGTAAPRTAPPTGKLTGDIGAALVNKQITPQAAVDQVVNRILDRQIGPGDKSPARSNVESFLREAMEADPLLSAKLKSLND
jgi:hypothetical protein